MDTFNIVLICIFTPLVLFCISMIGQLVCHFMKLQRLGHVFGCLAWWLTFFFVFPSRAKEYGFIRRKIISWPIALLSPPMLAICWFSYSIYTLDHALDYNELKVKTKDDIVAITGLKDIPPFHYVDNIYYGWDGTTKVYFLFDTPLSDDYIKKLNDMSASEDECFLKADTLTCTVKGNEADKYIVDKFGVTETIWKFHHGWDGEIIKRPSEKLDSTMQVDIIFGKKGFIVEYNSLVVIPDNLNGKSLKKVVGVNIPDFKVVDCSYTASRDPVMDAIIEFKSKPSMKLLKQLESSPNWTKLKDEDGRYEWRIDDNGHWEYLYIDKDSRFASYTYECY